MARLIDDVLEADHRTEGQSHQVFLLTGPDDPLTTVAPHPIGNDTTTASERGWAWTLGQHYARLDRLRAAPATTSGLG